MPKKITIYFALAAALLLGLPHQTHALQMPQSGNELTDMVDLHANSFAVMDVDSGQILISKNPDLPWAPASLTKLMTALVVLDAKIPLARTVTMTTADQTAGECSSGGSCIKSKSGVKFTVDGLFHAALLPSANNAANALSRSTGMSRAQFVAKMNSKARALGATNTHFVEPTGISPSNTTTAADYAKILNAAFSNKYLKQIAELNSFHLRSSNNSKYTQTIKNTDKLLSNADVQVIGAKTGYLNESAYNFASILSYHNGPQMAVVVLGEQHLYNAFADTQVLARLGQEAKGLAALGLFNE